MPTLYGMIPYAGVSFLTYESLKETALHYPWAHYESARGRPELTGSVLLVCGAVSGLLAQTMSYPLEIVRRHMQVAARTGDKSYTTFQTIRHIYARKGFKGFWVGLSIGYMKVTPMFAVSFYVYEWSKAFLDID